MTRRCLESTRDPGVDGAGRGVNEPAKRGVGGDGNGVDGPAKRGVACNERGDNGGVGGSERGDIGTNMVVAVLGIGGGGMSACGASGPCDDDAAAFSTV